MVSRTVRSLFRAVILGTILLVPFVIGTAAPAGAHAVLEAASPADGSVLDEPPTEVVLTFSEPVSLVTGSLRVFDANKKRVDAGVATKGESSNMIQIPLEDDLPNGSYAVSWRVISADSHPVHGGFVFSVQSTSDVDSLDDLIDQPSQPGYEAAGVVLRGASYLGSFIVVGIALYVVFVTRRDDPDPTRIFGPVSLVSGVVAVVAQLVLLPVDAALATGQGPGSLFSEGVLGEVLGQGVGLTVLGVVLACAAGVLALRRTGRTRAVLALGSLVLVTAAFVVSGHTRATDPAWLMNLGDVVHVAAAAVWTGGIVALAWSLRSRRRSDAPTEPELAAAEVAGFSRIATVAIVAVAVAGVAMSWVEVRYLEGLFSTTYGWLVVVKVGLLVVLAALGGFNQFRLLPALRRRPDRGARWRYLRTTLRLELIVIVAVLGVTGWLVNLEQAKTTVAMQSLVSETVPIETGSVNVVIDPARTGPMTLHVYILDPNGRPDGDVEEVSVSLVQSELDIGPLSHDLERAGPGHYLINGSLFTVSGDWKITFHVRMDEFTERSGSVDVEVRS